MVCLMIWRNLTASILGGLYLLLGWCCSNWWEGMWQLYGKVWGKFSSQSYERERGDRTFQVSISPLREKQLEMFRWTYDWLTDWLTPRRYNPCRVLADSRRRLQPSLSLALVIQFLIPNLSASLITPSIHLRFGLPARLLPSGLSKVIFLHGMLSCIRTICPAHLNLVILIVVTRSVSSHRQYSSSLYLDLHVASSQMGP